MSIFVTRDANYKVIAKLDLQVIQFWKKNYQSVKLRPSRTLKVVKLTSFLPSLFKARLPNPFQKQKTEPINLQNARSLAAPKIQFGLPRVMNHSNSTLVLSGLEVVCHRGWLKVTCDKKLWNSKPLLKSLFIHTEKIHKADRKKILYYLSLELCLMRKINGRYTNGLFMWVTLSFFF